MIRLALAVMLAGCFSKPGLTPSDAPTNGDGSGSDGPQCSQSGAGLALEENTVSHRLIARIPNGYSITFADPGTKYPYPIAINYSSEQLLAPAGNGCGREDVVGVAAFPIYSIGGAQTPTNPNVHPLDTPVVGPANIQLVSNWTYQHPSSCGGASMHGNGRTTWSLFPDGRVVRYDYLQPADNGVFQTEAPPCSCVGSISNFTISSFMAIAMDMVVSLTATGASEGATPIPPADVQDARGACFQTPGSARVAIRWDDSSQGRHESRIRRFDDEIVFVNDIVPGGGAGADDTLSPIDTYTLRTHMFLEGDPSAMCTSLNDKLQSHALAPPVLVDGELIAVDGLGFYDDTIMNRDHGSAVTLHADNGRVEAGWALRIRFQHYNSITTSIPSIWQHEDDDVFYIFFPDGVANDEMVTITPECRRD